MSPSRPWRLGGLHHLRGGGGGRHGIAGGAFLASLLIGLVQTFAVALDYSLASALQGMGVAVSEQTFGWPLLKLTVSQVAPILPYLFLVLILIFRPKGLLGTRED
jgi:branched-chain amino acid transport system permease protein